MAEEMKNQETMDDFAKEIDASFESLQRRGYGHLGKTGEDERGQDRI